MALVLPHETRENPNRDVIDGSRLEVSLDRACDSDVSTFQPPPTCSARLPPAVAYRSAHVAVRFSSHALKMASCVAKSAVFASAARPNKAKAGAKSSRAASKLWTPRSAAVDSPTIIVEGDAESKMAGLTAKRREVIMDMEDFAENEVRARPDPTPRARGRLRVSRRHGHAGRLEASDKAHAPRSVARPPARPNVFLPVARARAPSLTPPLPARVPCPPPTHSPSPYTAPEAPEAHVHELAAARSPSQPRVARFPG